MIYCVERLFLCSYLQYNQEVPLRHSETQQQRVHEQNNVLLEHALAMINNGHREACRYSPIYFLHSLWESKIVVASSSVLTTCSFLQEKVL